MRSLWRVGRSDGRAVPHSIQMYTLRYIHVTVPYSVGPLDEIQKASATLE
jgi:hypothetical protein